MRWLEKSGEPGILVSQEEISRNSVTWPGLIELLAKRHFDPPAILPEPGLRLLGAVPDSQLPELYASALACVYPSR